LLELTNHKCNEDDWVKFNKPLKRQETLINDFKKKGFFYCLDEVQKDEHGNPIKLADLKLYGEERINQAELDIVYKPCYPVKWTQEREDNNEKCLVKVEKDSDMEHGSDFMKNRLAETNKYLGTCMFYTYYNQQGFNH
jgi:hypothetical protein